MKFVMEFIFMFIETEFFSLLLIEPKISSFCTIEH